YATFLGQPFISPVPALTGVFSKEYPLSPTVENTELKTFHLSPVLNPETIIQTVIIWCKSIRHQIAALINTFNFYLNSIKSCTTLLVCSPQDIVRGDCWRCNRVSDCRIT